MFQNSASGSSNSSGGSGSFAPRTTRTGETPNNLPPLTFHSVHGENVRISADGSTATRVESFSKGLAFSARPVTINEKVYIRFVEISTMWHGVMAFGFTSHDPGTLSRYLPQSACRYLANKPGYWMNALDQRFCRKDNILHYYMNPAGDVHFGVNGEDKGLFFSGVDKKSPLWSLVDVYGTCTAVQFVDPSARTQMRRPNQSPLDEDRLVGSMRSLPVGESLPPPKYANPLVPLSLHRTKGRNVQFENDRGVAARTEDEPCQGYVFTARPMRPGHTILVQILSTEAAHASSLAFGLTSCDPATLRPCDLPDDSELLLVRPEYWVVRRDAANGMRRGDELAVTLTLYGEVRVSRNGSTPVTVVYVDLTLRLWAFVDIYGATQKVRMLSSQAMRAPTLPPLLHRQPRRADSQYSSHNSVEQAQIPNGHPLRIPERIPNGPSTSRQPPPRCSTIGEGTGNLTSTECIICFENSIDSVLYMCGHMCMCNRCAVQQWKGKGGGKCPICRAKIRDVIRTYKS